MKSKKQLTIVVGVLAALLLVLLVYIMTDEPEISEEDKKIEKSTTDPTMEFPQDEETPVVPIEVQLANYKKWAKYPPNSRPLRKEYEDIIEHQIIKEAAHPMPRIDKDGNVQQTSYSCNLQPQTHTVTEGMTEHITLFCWKQAGEKNVEPVDIEFSEHTFTLVQSWDGKRRGLLSGEIHDDGKNGDAGAKDKTYTISWKPRRTDWGSVEFEVKFRIKGDPDKVDYKLKTTFFSSPVAPARFVKNSFTDSLRDGSLKVAVQLNVKKAGTYRLDANLKSLDGEWIAWANEQKYLERGIQSVEFTFFGKIFHDKDQECPCVVTGLRGYRLNDPFDTRLISDPAKAASSEALEKVMSSKQTQPDREVIPLLNQDYTTQRYEQNQFSDKEWDSEIKQDRIQQLESAAQTAP